MTEAKKDPKENKLKTIKDVIFVYTSVSQPKKQLNEDNKPPLSDDPLEFHGFEVKILITESRFKNLKKAFKGAKNFPNAKDCTKEDAVTRFGIEEPDEDCVIIKFTQNCLNGKKGARKPSRPLNQIGIKGKVQDRNGLEVTFETNVGHGSKGHLQFNPYESSFGLYLYPTTVCITELVEFTSSAGEMDEDAFGMEDLDEVQEEEMGGSEDDEFEDDIPF